MKELIERNNNHPDENNTEGKKSYLIDIINKIPDSHLDWLIQVIENRYHPKLKKLKQDEN